MRRGQGASAAFASARAFAAKVETGLAMSECAECLTLVQIVTGQAISPDRRLR
jgi:hypothetical protein